MRWMIFNIVLIFQIRKLIHILKDTNDSKLYRYNHWIWREVVPYDYKDQQDEYLTESESDEDFEENLTDDSENDATVESDSE